MPNLSRLISVSALALVTGCTTAGPDFQRPAAPAALWAAVYYALVPGVLGFWLWFAGAERLAGAQASLMTAVMPVSALALSAAVLGERVSAWQMGGCALVLLAVLAASAPGLGGRKRPTPL